MTGVVALESLITSLQQQNITVLIANLLPRMQAKLTRAGIQEKPDKLEYHTGLEAIRQRILSRHDKH